VPARRAVVLYTDHDLSQATATAPVLSARCFGGHCFEFVTHRASWPSGAASLPQTDRSPSAATDTEQDQLGS
jgi:hypothetical protein